MPLKEKIYFRTERYSGIEKLGRPQPEQIVYKEEGHRGGLNRRQHAAPAGLQIVEGVHDADHQIHYDGHGVDEIVSTAGIIVGISDFDDLKRAFAPPVPNGGSPPYSHCAPPNVMNNLSF